MAALTESQRFRSRRLINRLLEGTGLHCIPSSSSPLPDIQSFGILHSIKSGELSKALLAALDDGEITKQEKAEIYKHLSDLNVFLASLRETLELDGVGGEDDWYFLAEVVAVVSCCIACAYCDEIKSDIKCIYRSVVGLLK